MLRGERIGSVEPASEIIRTPFYRHCAIFIAACSILILLVFRHLGQELAGWFQLTVALRAAVDVLARERVTFSVDRDGVRLEPRWGLGKTSIPRGEIAAVRAEDLVPSEWQSWGMVRRYRRAAFITHGRSAVVFERRDGSTFAVTVSDPQRYVDALEGYLAEPPDSVG